MNRAAGTHPRSKAQPAQLTLPWLLNEMAAAGLIAAGAEKQLAAAGGHGRETSHPLTALAARELDDPRCSGRKLTLESLVQWLAEHSGVPYMRIDPLSIDVARITSVIPYAYAARLRILPVTVSPSAITFAVSDPFAVDWLQDLEPALKAPIKRVLANPHDIERYLVEFYAVARSVKASGEERSKIAPTGLHDLEQLTQLSRAGKLTAEDQHVAAIVDWLLQYAFEARASDIHFEPRRDSGNVRFRIDGILHQVYQIPALVMPAVISRIKILARLDVAEKRRPQDGRIKTRAPGGKEIELRASALPTAFGEKLVLRIFNPDILVRDFSALGFSLGESHAWRAMIEQSHGIALVTGPTGSGKTTTLYSSLKQLATDEVNICTIEDPIEMVDPGFNQMQVQPNIDLSFADGVRALLRQDPDIIMVGEIRDLETAEVAVQAALTGHLVLSTLHTNDAPSAITRLLELGVPAYLIKATLNGVVAQRLVRTLCPHCKSQVTPSAATWSELSGGGEIPRPAHVFEAVGCLECRQTGYLGRSGVYEIMTMSSSLRARIGAHTEIAALRTDAVKEGMRPLRTAGCMKVAAGLTSISEVLSLTPTPAGTE